MIRRRAPDNAQSFDDAWSSGDLAGTPAEIGELVRTAELLCRSAVAEPSEAFRTGLRDRLMVEAADVLVAPMPAPAHTESAPRPDVADAHPVRRRLAGLTAAAVATVGSVGMITTSATAVPGDVLYPLKRGVESVQLALHRGDTSRGEFQLDQARERLAEAQWLDSNDRDARVADVLENFSDQATNGSTQLFAVYVEDNATATIDTVNDFATAATISLAALSDDLPADAQAALALAADTVTNLASQASTLCTACVPADVSSLTAAVDEAARSTPNAPALSSDPAAPDGADESAGSGTQKPSTPDTSGVSGSVPSPGSNAPVAPPAPKSPTFKDLTDPLISGPLATGGGTGQDPDPLDDLLGDVTP